MKTHPSTSSSLRPSRLTVRGGLLARSARGLSLVEATIILATVSILSAILAPTISGYIDQARIARAREDVRVIGDAINTFIDDNGEKVFLQDGVGAAALNPPANRRDNGGTSYRVNLLVSDGDVPTGAAGVTDVAFWLQAVSATFVQTLSDHLIENQPNDTTANRYRNPNDVTTASTGGNIDFARTESSGFNAPYAWRGAYLKSPVNADPWGNRYAVNVGFLDPSPTIAIANISTAVANYPRMDVFVISAGGDEEIDTTPEQDGAVPGDDDIIYVVSSNAK